MKPVDFVGETDESGGIIYEYLNDTSAPVQCEYACITAPKIIKCEVFIDGKLVDTVYAGNGGSHSWWTAAQGRLLSKPLQPNSKLKIVTNGKSAFRIDWYD